MGAKIFMNYVIISGYHRTGKDSDSFAALWWSNLKRYANPAPKHTYIIETNGGPFPIRSMDITTIPTFHNLGHVGMLLSGEKKYELCGWSASTIAGLMIAYNTGADAIYLESDALAFGPWVKRVYSDIGDAGFVFGRQMKSAPWMCGAQSLFMVKHAYIPKFCSEYLRMGSEMDVANLPENKHCRMEGIDGANVRRLSFGFDRERPIQYEDEVFYAQKLSQEELHELNKRGLL